MEHNTLEQAARDAGISSGFINAHGQQQAIAAETKRELLSAMGWTADRRQAVTPVPGVKVFVAGQRLALPVEGDGEYLWTLQLESGATQRARISGKMTLALAGKIPPGYHQLTLTQAAQTWECRVIVAPKRCYEPDALLAGKSCGAPACSFIRCARTITGASVISAI